MELPKDPIMLFGVINMNLRDKYDSLDELCHAMDLDEQFLIETLATAGFEYSKENNKFW